MTQMYGEYVTSWGGKQVSYKLEGYKNGHKVCETEKGAMTGTVFYVKPDTVELTEDETYDVTRIEVKALSQYLNVLPYDNSIINIETNGIVDVIGPKSVALQGGQIAFWVKTVGKTGKAVITVSSEKLGKKEIEINVNKI